MSPTMDNAEDKLTTIMNSSYHVSACQCGKGPGDASRVVWTWVWSFFTILRYLTKYLCRIYVLTNTTTVVDPVVDNAGRQRMTATR